MKIHGIGLIPDGDMVVSAFRKHGAFENESMRAWKEYLEPGTIAVDVGAYTGIYSLFAAKSGHDVIAIEPSPQSFERMVKNAERNDVIFPMIQAAVGRSCGETCLSVKSDLSSANSIGGDYDKTIVVDMATVDCIVDGLDVSAIKIDVEGYEPEVLAGSVETIMRSRPAIITEANNQESEWAQLNIMGQLGYSIFKRCDVRNIVWLPEL